MIYDVAIIGGSYAGLAAATQLARARRNIIVIDEGQRRNRFAENSHGFLTQDGTEASEIVEIGKAQLLAYKTVNWQTGGVKRIETKNSNFHICIDETCAVTAKKIIIATGVQDILPDISGLKERWGKSIFHCPYCHGYELNQGKIGLLAMNKHSIQLALMLPDWGNTTLLLNGRNDLLDPEVIEQLHRRKVIIDDRLIHRIDGHADVIFSHRENEQFDGLFVGTQTMIQQPWIFNLGLVIDENEFGQIIQTSTLKETSISGIFACGDVARLGGSVTLAVADGTMAGVSAHRSLIF